MSTVQRRVIWLTDEEWAHLNARAAREGLNASNLIRKSVGIAAVQRLDRFGHPSPVPKPTR